MTRQARLAVFAVALGVVAIVLAIAVTARAATLPQVAAPAMLVTADAAAVGPIPEEGIGPSDWSAGILAEGLAALETETAQPPASIVVSEPTGEGVSVAVQGPANVSVVIVAGALPATAWVTAGPVMGRGGAQVTVKS